MIKGDAGLLRALARMLERNVPESRVYRPAVFIDEFVRTLEGELDFVGEAAATARFAAAFAGDPHIVIPEVRWDLTRAGVLTLGRLDGKNISRPEALEEFRVDRKKVAERLLDAFICQYFRLGLFHADPHPGNLMVLGPDKVALLDFGLVGHLSDDMRDRLVTALLASLERELSVVVAVFAEMGSLSEDTDVEELKADTQKLIDKYFGLALGRFALDHLFNEITGLCRRHSVLLPKDFVLILRSLITIAGVGMTLDPELDLAGLLRPRLQQVLLDRFNVREIGKKLLVAGWQWKGLLAAAPGQLSDLLRKANGGRLSLKVRLPELEQASRELDRAGNRLTLGMLTAGVFIGSSLMMAQKAPPLIYDQVSVLGLIGTFLSGLGALLLLRAISKSGLLS
jgi:ubiquinone biosynthesis protein